MKLFFLRHGLAGDPAEWRGDDFDRPLTKEGRKRLKHQGKVFAKLPLELDTIVTSPLVRARETADIVADALDGKNRVVSDPRLGPGFDRQRLSAILDEHRDAETVMLVGHEPSMSQTIVDIVGGGRIDLKKGGLAYVDVPERTALRGTLVWLVAPKVLLL
ncbi:MAG: phosphohistidine phosphatase SixA [Candidatus Eremiobacteraeota bacterium]|nr:phosphohistidine phosphatase SixA [Candidatus Eremiobacteraeota bacterium]MBV9646418.1 phosphohistidine phosphatase SixA [Candidatus Eremiobacteraeota bacterium]